MLDSLWDVQRKIVPGGAVHDLPKDFPVFNINTEPLYNRLRGAYNRNNGEVHFNIDDDKTIVYNEGLGVFNGFYTYKPVFYVSLNKALMSIKDGVIHMHDFIDDSYFYGKPCPSVMHVMSNKQFGMTKMFDSFQIYAPFFNNYWGLDKDETTYNDYKSHTGEIITGQTNRTSPFNTFNFYNSYQQTGEKQVNYAKFDPKSDEDNLVIDRRERVWSIKIPKNNEKVNGQDDLFKDRMRDNYLGVKFTVNPNFKVKIPYVTTNFRYAIR
jgi:hypothetical protein